MYTYLDGKPAVHLPKATGIDNTPKQEKNGFPWMEESKGTSPIFGKTNSRIFLSNAR